MPERPLRLTIRQLEALLAIAEERTFTGAAQKLHLTQPTLTRTIQTLEHDLRQQLIVRGSMRVSLTPSGQRAVQTARHVIDELRALERACRDPLDVRGTLRIACTSMGSRYVYKRFLDNCIEENPSIDFSLHTVSSAKDAIRMLSDGLVDIAFSPLPLRAGSGRLHAYRLGRVQHVIVLRADLPTCTAAPVMQDELVTYPFALFEEGTGSRAYFERYLLPEMVERLTVVAESNDTEFIKQLVVQGRGVALLPLPTVREELATGTFRQLTGDGLGHSEEFGLVVRNSDDSPQVRVIQDVASGGADFSP